MCAPPRLRDIANAEVGAWGGEGGGEVSDSPTGVDYVW